jgi:hypothetical protein
LRARKSGAAPPPSNTSSWCDPFKWPWTTLPIYWKWVDVSWSKFDTDLVLIQELSKKIDVQVAADGCRVWTLLYKNTTMAVKVTVCCNFDLNVCSLAAITHTISESSSLCQRSRNEFFTKSGNVINLFSQGTIWNFPLISDKGGIRYVQLAHILCC